MIEKLYTVEEVAELASVTGRTIRNYLKSGRLVGRKIGGQWRFPEAEVQRLLTGAEPEPEAPASAAEAPPVQPTPPTQAAPPAQAAPPPAPVPQPPPEDAPPEPVRPAAPEAPVPAEDTSPIYQEAPAPQPAARPAGGYCAEPAPLPPAAANVPPPVADPPAPEPTPPPVPAQPPVSSDFAPSAPPAGQQAGYAQPPYPPQQTAQPQPVTACTPGDAPPAATSGYATFEQPPVQPRQPGAPTPGQAPPAYVVPLVPPQYDSLPVQSYTFAAPAPMQYQPGTPAYYLVPQAMLGVPTPPPEGQPAPAASSAKSDEEKPKNQDPPADPPTPKAAAAPQLSDVGNRVARFMSQVHDCSAGPAMCAVVDMNQSLSAAKMTSERLNEIADLESNEDQPCQCFVEYDDRYFIARYTLFGSTHFLLRCLKLIG